MLPRKCRKRKILDPSFFFAYNFDNPKSVNSGFRGSVNLLGDFYIEESELTFLSLRVTQIGNARVFLSLLSHMLLKTQKMERF